MDKTKRYLSVAFVAVLAIVIVVSLIGMILLKKKPVILQGQIEATEIRISGKLPGRIDTFLVKEGQNVRQGDTLVVINSPEALAKYQQVNAMENIAKYQHQKVDEGTRTQIIASLQQSWNKSKSDLQLAKITYDRVNALYKDSVVTSQRKDEVEAMYKAAEAAERAAYSQYQMAVDGAQIQDKESARSLVTAAQAAGLNRGGGGGSLTGRSVDGPNRDKSPLSSRNGRAERSRDANGELVVQMTHGIERT